MLLILGKALKFMLDTSQQKAVVYCRVASYKHTEKEYELSSQEKHCREFAKSKGYEVVNIFHDVGISGENINRSSMNTLLAYLSEQQGESIVIIEDVVRLSRDVSIHMHLRNEIIKAGGKLESPAIDFDEDPQSEFLENILASFSQHQLDKTHSH